MNSVWSLPRQRARSRAFTHRFTVRVRRWSAASSLTSCSSRVVSRSNPAGGAAPTCSLQTANLQINTQLDTISHGGSALDLSCPQFNEEAFPRGTRFHCASQTEPLM